MPWTTKETVSNTAFPCTFLPGNSTFLHRLAVTMPLNCEGMYRGVIREDGVARVAIFADEEVAPAVDEEEKKKANQRVAALEASLEEEKGAREARAQEIAELRRTMNNNANATATERANLQKRIAELERRKSRGGGCVLQ